MLKSGRGKSTARKPLADISNGGKPSEPCKKKTPPPVDDGDDDGALDRLILARSDLSNLINQIDELVVQALQLKMISRRGSQDIESFRHVLSDMHSSLKPWVSKLQQAFGGTSEKHLDPSIDTNPFTGTNREGNVVPSNKGEPELDLIVSPSPLVSWRAGACTVESGKQLFLLTPLPKPKMLSSKCRGLSKPMVGVFTDKDPPHSLLGVPPLSIPKNACADLVERVEVKVPPTDASRPCTKEAKSSASECDFFSPNFLNHKSRKNSICLLTPCLKKSPPKSCPLANLIPESFQDDDGDIPKPTQEKETQVSDDLTFGEVSASLAPKYQELLELQPSQNFTSWKKDLDGTLDWFLSPPKTCILMEPSDGKLLPTPATGALLTTSMLKDFESTVRRGKQPGENTLKRELWIKFDAVSTNGLHLDASVFQTTTRKGFLDMLEEASCETEDSDSGVAR